MFKKIFLILLLSSNSFVLRAANDCTCNSQYNEWSTTGRIVFWGAAGTGAVIAAPYVLPAGAVTAIAAGVAATKAAVVAGATQAAGYAASASTVSKISWGLSAAQYTRPFILETTKEKLKQLQKEKERKHCTAREKFVTCLKQNKFDSERNAAGRPSACEDLALGYALVAGMTELHRRTKAFKDGKCFCA